MKLNSVLLGSVVASKGPWPWPKRNDTANPHGFANKLVDDGAPTCDDFFSQSEVNFQNIVDSHGFSGSIEIPFHGNNEACIQRIEAQCSKFNLNVEFHGIDPWGNCADYFQIAWTSADQVTYESTTKFCGLNNLLNMVYVDNYDYPVLEYDIYNENNIAMAFPEEGIQIETDGGFEFHWFTDGWSRFEGVKLNWSCDGKGSQRVDPCSKVTDQSQSFFGLADVVELDAPRKYTTSDLIRNSLPMKGQNRQNCLNMCSLMAGCYAVNYYDDSTCMLLLNAPVAINSQKSYPEQFGGGDAQLTYSGKLYDKCNGLPFTQERRFDSAFYCKFTSDAGADDLIAAFVAENGGNEDTQLNVWTIKFNPTAAIPYSFAQKFEIEKRNPAGEVADGEEGLFWLQFKVVTFVREPVQSQNQRMFRSGSESSFDIDSTISGWQQSATIPDVATLEETTETDTEVFVLDNGVELGKVNDDGSLTCSAGMVSDGNGGCEVEGGAEKADLLSDIENGVYETLQLGGEFEGLYKMQNGLGYYDLEDGNGFVY